MSARHRVVVLGGGFAGLHAVRGLAGAGVEITLVDRRNHHLFQPLLYQVATGGLSPSDIAAPLRHLFNARPDVRVLQGEVAGLDVPERSVHLSDGAALPYDTLVVATGAKPFYFGNDAWEAVAPGLKELEDATRIRGAILSAFERAELEADPERREALLAFAVVGAGPTGVELAGALAELARDTLRRDFRSIDPALARIHLVEASDRVLGAYPPELSERAVRSLERLCVEVHTGTKVVDLAPGRLRVEMPSGDELTFRVETVLWAAGVQASGLARELRDAAGAELDRMGRVHVAPDLSLPDHPEILVAGDIAHVLAPDGEPVPAVAPAAMQAGRHVARVVRARLAGQEAPAFRYRDKGSLATIGRAAAVAQLGRLRFSGFPAWVLWLAVHLLYLVGFANRALVLFQWGWNYVTRNRTARLITDVREER